MRKLKIIEHISLEGVIQNSADVNGHQDLPLGGQLTSCSADTRNPGRRTAGPLLLSGQWHHPLALGGLGQA
jgi:hypothetical protein